MAPNPLFHNALNLLPGEDSMPSTLSLLAGRIKDFPPPPIQAGFASARMTASFHSTPHPDYDKNHLVSSSHQKRKEST